MTDADPTALRWPEVLLFAAGSLLWAAGWALVFVRMTGEG